jgi:predicted alpha/beta-hydrolase family hydrolase
LSSLIARQPYSPRLKDERPDADSACMTAVTPELDASGIACLRARLDELERRRVQLLPVAEARELLEAMRFEIAEVSWQLAELEALS